MHLRNFDISNSIIHPQIDVTRCLRRHHPKSNRLLIHTPDKVICLLYLQIESSQLFALTHKVNNNIIFIHDLAQHLNFAWVSVIVLLNNRNNFNQLTSSSYIKTHNWQQKVRSHVCFINYTRTSFGKRFYRHQKKSIKFFITFFSHVSDNWLEW